MKLLPSPMRVLLPVAAGLVLAGAVAAGGEVQAQELRPGAKVRLLFPILSGKEYERLLLLAPQAVIVDVGGSSFVELGRFSDARVAHRLGLTIQRRLALPFDLAYDQDHPQLGEAMAGVLLPGVPPFPATAVQVPPGAVASTPVGGPAEADAIAAAAPLQPQQPEAAAPTAQDAAPSAMDGVPTGAPPLSAAAGTGQASAPPEPEPEPDAGRGALIERVLQRALTPLPLAPAQDDTLTAAAAPLQPQQPAAVSPPPRASRTGERPTALDAAPSDLSEVLREVLQPVPLAAHGGQDSTVPTTAGKNGGGKTGEPPSLHHPWLRPVAIAAVDAGVPITRLQPALNPDLNYLYVQIRQPGEVARVRGILPVQELAVQGDVVLARVGVFTASRQGEALLAARLERLRAERLEPLLARAGQQRQLAA